MIQGRKSHSTKENEMENKDNTTTNDNNKNNNTVKNTNNTNNNKHNGGHSQHSFSRKLNIFNKGQQPPPHRLPPPKPIKHRNDKSNKIEKQNKTTDNNNNNNNGNNLSKKRSWLFGGGKKESNIPPAATTSVVTSIMKSPENSQNYNDSPTDDSYTNQQRQHQHHHHRYPHFNHLQLTHMGTNIPRSKSWFLKNHNRSPSLLLNSAASSESEDQLDLLSTESTEQNVNTLTNLITRLEEDDSIPIVFSQYSGEPVFKRNIATPTIFKTQVSKFHKFDKFDESSYNLWNVWTIDETTNQKKIERLIECRSDFIEFFKNFNLKEVFIMKSNLVPNILQFKNGYLVKLKLLHGKTLTNTELGLNLFMKCCKYSILNNVPNNAIKINVCGFTYQQKRQLTQIVLWIHPILNMSFDIANQVELLIKSFNFGHNLNKITLVDINNNSKTVISVDLVG
ncbi:hypothetical protein KGF54_003278 [Candida jiufengensis]|uniref:uncharacterized protein n=1 Tax=Candida jiufengensis TaxID=497108 RepID=UPI0022243706|nr:uncharacterized protein KGF54_003278 [Candida jiufengensis]KAI5952411.1 hypothetical protein KGF54_003278 [Candida jiufengensis]